MPTLLVPGDTAPPLKSQAVHQGEVVDLTLEDALKGADYMLLVFYPADFTFVCPTEIVQFTEKFEDFRAQQCNIVCCSTDSVYTHLAWLKAPKAERGLGAANSGSLVLLSDRSHVISSAYGVLDSSGAAYRGTFLIDKNKTICQVTINDMPVGRSVDDALRMLTELRAQGTRGDQGVVLPVASGASNNRQVNSSNAKTSELMETSHVSQKLPRELRHKNRQRSVTIHTADNHPSGIVKAVSSHKKDLCPSHTLDIAHHPVPHYSSNNHHQSQHHQQQPQHPLLPQLQQQLQHQHQPQHQQLRIDLAITAAEAQAAQLETQAAQLRLQDSEARLARLLAEADQLRAQAASQADDTRRLKAEARARRTEWDRLRLLDGRGCGKGDLAPSLE